MSNSTRHTYQAQISTDAYDTYAERALREACHQLVASLSTAQLKEVFNVTVIDPREKANYIKDYNVRIRASYASEIPKLLEKRNLLMQECDYLAERKVVKITVQINIIPNDGQNKNLF